MTIEDICINHDITMAELSRMYNIPYKTMQNWKYGRTEAPEYVLTLIEKVLDYEKKVRH